MGLEEAFEEPAFWILGGGGVAMELLGWIISKRLGWGAFPLWQLAILIVGTLFVAAFFALRD